MIKMARETNGACGISFSCFFGKIELIFCRKQFLGSFSLFCFVAPRFYNQCHSAVPSMVFGVLDIVDRHSASFLTSLQCPCAAETGKLKCHAKIWKAEVRWGPSSCCLLLMANMAVEV